MSERIGTNEQQVARALFSALQCDLLGACIPDIGESRFVQGKGLSARYSALGFVMEPKDLESLRDLGELDIEVCTLFNAYPDIAARIGLDLEQASALELLHVLWAENKTHKNLRRFKDALVLIATGRTLVVYGFHALGATFNPTSEVGMCHQITLENL